MLARKKFELVAPAISTLAFAMRYLELMPGVGDAMSGGDA